MNPLTFCSDLHIVCDEGLEEFVQAYENFPGTLLIAGDFAEVGQDTNSIFFRTFETLFEVNEKIYVVFICGNHEYYGSSIESVESLIKDWVEEEDMDRFFFLREDFEFLYLKRTTIIGSTLWYPDTPDVWFLKSKINDFTQIKNFGPEVAFERNTLLKESLLSYCADIWLFHHLPSYTSVAREYKGSRLNCYYVDSEIEKILREVTQPPKLIIHGHTHSSNCYQIGDTWIVSNPKGYSSAENPQFNYLKHIFWV